jgi:hypothetical protein
MYDSLEKLPPQPGAVLLALLVIFGGLGLAGFGAYTALLDDLRQEVEEQVRSESPLLGGHSKDPAVIAKVAALEKLGWRDVEQFVTSDLGTKYADGEFPVSLAFLPRKGERVSIEVTMWNKSDSWVTLSVTLGGQAEQIMSGRQGATPYTPDLLMAAHSKRVTPLSIDVPKSNAQAILVKAFITDADGHLNVIDNIVAVPE